MAATTVHVYPDRETAADHGSDGPSVVLDDVRRAVPENTANELYGRLANLDVDSPYSMPVYTVYQNRLWRNRWQNTPGPEYYSTELLIPLYEAVERRVESADADAVAPVGLDVVERHLVADVAAATDCAVVDRTDRRLERFARTLSLALAGLWQLLVLVVDHLLSLVLAPLFPAFDGDRLFVFSAGRPRTVKPLYEAMDDRPDLLVTTSTVSYLLHHRDHFDSPFAARPIHTVGSLRTVLAGVRLSLGLFADLLWRGEFAAAVADAIADSEGVRLDRTCTLLLRLAVFSNVEALVLYPPARRLFGRTAYESMLVPNFARPAKALVHASDERTDRYHLPHSVMLQVSKYDTAFDRTMFVSGEIDESYMRDARAVDPVVTGYPKHVDIQRIYGELQSRPDVEAGEDDTVVVATQGYADDIRREFVEAVTDAVLDRTDLNLSVKPHPGESVAFYRETLSDLGHGDTDRVRVVEGALYERIYRARAVVTIGSNVAIEALVLDTPALCYNSWTPFLRTPLFVKYGSVPQLESPAAFESFVADWDLESMRRDQRSMVEGPYRVRGNDIESITARVQSELAR